MGESMGGAILLQALRGNSRFVAVVAESSFSSLREAAYDRVAEQVGCGAWMGRTLLRPVVDTGFWWARLRYGLNLDAISPAAAAAATQVPILLIHGADDRNIPPAHSRRILAGAHGRVELWLPPQTGHTGALGRWPAEFERRVTDWFNVASVRK
jgi:dipeptidyl aminopeptidase/acylaminoacyl peptidase